MAATVSSSFARWDKGARFRWRDASVIGSSDGGQIDALVQGAIQFAARRA
jgi:hypothetical protein